MPRIDGTASMIAATPAITAIRRLLFIEFLAIRCLALELLENLISNTLKKKLSMHMINRRSMKTAMNDGMGK